jgi:hypothetical protein
MAALAYLAGSAVALVVEAVRRRPTAALDLAIYVAIPGWVSLMVLALGWPADWAATQRRGTRVVRLPMGLRVYFPAVSVVMSAVVGGYNFRPLGSLEGAAYFVATTCVVGIVTALPGIVSFEFDRAGMARRNALTRSTVRFGWHDVGSVDLAWNRQVRLRTGQCVVVLPEKGDGLGELAEALRSWVPAGRYSPEAAEVIARLATGGQAKGALGDAADPRGPAGMWPLRAAAVGVVLAAGLAAWVTSFHLSGAGLRLAGLAAVLAAVGGLGASWLARRETGGRRAPP